MLMRNYPKSIQIGDSIWDVKFARSLGDNVTLGLCDPSTNTIQLKMGQDPGELFKTLIHEVVHAIEDEYNFHLKHKVVEQLEVGLAAFLLDNIDAISTIINGKKKTSEVDNAPK